MLANGLNENKNIAVCGQLLPSHWAILVHKVIIVHAPLKSVAKHQ